MIRVMAPLRPPAWFHDARCLAVMQALFCLQRRPRLSAGDVVAALEQHGVLDLVGGRAEVEALVAPGPDLEAARADLAAARHRLGPVEAEPIVVFARQLLRAELETSDLPGSGGGRVNGCRARRSRNARRRRARW